MSTDRRGPDGRIKRNATDAIVDTQDAENGRAESWQAGPSKKDLSNATFARDIHKTTGSSRTDLRTTDAHASWREVYAQCHVGVGVE